MMKRIRLIAGCLLAGGLVAFLATGAAGIDSETAPAGYQSTGYTAVGHSDVLLVQDVLPWGQDANAAALTAHGASFSVISSSMLSTYDMSGYRVVMYASDQPTSYYQRVAANLGRIQSFVAGGGTLLGHACDAGWNTGSWSGLFILPGNVTRAGTSQQSIHIVDASHPVMSGLSDGYLSGWNASTHGHFTNLPGGAQVIAATSGNPTYIQYQWGSGRVLATMQTVEWGYYRFHPALLDNEIDYALSPVPEPSGLLALVSGIGGLGGLMWRRRT